MSFKKWLCALAALAAFLMAAALGEGATQTFETKHFKMTVPADWVIDCSNLKHKDSNWELGYLYPPGDSTLCVYADLRYYDNWSDISLWKADEATMDEYKRVLLEDYESYSAEFVETIYVGRIPFIVIKLYDNGSAVYWIETMTNGYAVGFECYALGDTADSYRSVTQEEYEQIIDILSTFEPII